MDGGEDIEAVRVVDFVSVVHITVLVVVVVSVIVVVVVVVVVIIKLEKAAQKQIQKRTRTENFRHLGRQGEIDQDPAESNVSKRSVLDPYHDGRRF